MVNSPGVLRRLAEDFFRADALDPTYRKLVADQYLVFYHVNENVKVVEIHRVLRGSWNLPQYLE